jgi:hypothetical protein
MDDVIDNDFMPSRLSTLQQFPSNSLIRGPQQTPSNKQPAVYSFYNIINHSNSIQQLSGGTFGMNVVPTNNNNNNRQTFIHQVDSLVD